MEDDTVKHRQYRCPSWKEIRSQICKDMRKWDQPAKLSKDE